MRTVTFRQFRCGGNGKSKAWGPVRHKGWEVEARPLSELGARHQRVLLLSSRPSGTPKGSARATKPVGGRETTLTRCVKHCLTNDNLPRQTRHAFLTRGPQDVLNTSPLRRKGQQDDRQHMVSQRRQRLVLHLGLWEPPAQFLVGALALQHLCRWASERMARVDLELPGKFHPSAGGQQKGTTVINALVAVAMLQAANILPPPSLVARKGRWRLQQRV